MRNFQSDESGGQSKQTSIPLRYKVTQGALASGAATTVTRVLTIALSIATARALEPGEVGSLGIAIIIVAVISMIGCYPEMSSVAARGEQEDESFAFAGVVIRAVVVALLILLVKIMFPIAAEQFTGSGNSNSELRQLLGILLWAPILELLAGYPKALLQRRLDLSFIAGAGLVQPLIFVGLAVSLLLGGYGYMGVVWANLVGTAALTFVLWIRLWRKGWVKWVGWPLLSVWRATASGATRIFIGGIGGFVGERLDNLLVAGTLGATEMSFYSMAWNGARAPANIFGAAINFVLVPTLARIQNDAGRVECAIRESLRHSYILLTPVCAAMFVSAPLLVAYILGEKWLPLVPCLRVMCITVLTIPVAFAAGALLTGTGRAHLMGIAMVIHLMTLIAAIPPLAHKWGPLGASYGDLLAMTISTTILCLTARFATGLIRWALSSALATPVAASALSALLVWIIGPGLGSGLMRLFGEIALVVIGYLLFIVIFGGKAKLLESVNLMRNAVRRQVVTANAHT